MPGRLPHPLPGRLLDPHGNRGPEIEVPHLEVDESVPPRPEEEIADATRTEDPAD